jgi:Ca2+-binding RTX toxin-like protein
VVAIPVALCVGVPTAQAKNGDTHITGQGVNQTLDCNESTLIVMGTGNTINALGSCWAITVQGSANVIKADNVVNDITVYGFDQTVLYRSGDPQVLDRGREIGLTNRIDRLSA